MRQKILEKIKRPNLEMLHTSVNLLFINQFFNQNKELDERKSSIDRILFINFILNTYIELKFYTRDIIYNILCKFIYVLKHVYFVL